MIRYLITTLLLLIKTMGLSLAGLFYTNPEPGNQAVPYVLVNNVLYSGKNNKADINCTIPLRAPAGYTRNAFLETGYTVAQEQTANHRNVERHLLKK